MKKSELIFASILVPIDALAILLAIATAYFLRSSGQTNIYLWPFSYYLKTAIIFLPVWLIVFSTQGLYRVKSVRRGWDEFTGIISGVLYSWALFTVGLYFLRTPQTIVFPRLILIYTLLLPLLYVVIARFLAHSIQRYLYRFNIGVRKMLLIGCENTATQSLVRNIQNNRSLGYRVIKIFPTSEITTLAELHKTIPFDGVILTDPKATDENVMSYIRFCEDHNLVFRQVPNLFEVRSSRVQLTTLAGMPVIEFISTPLEGWGRILKRIFDILGGIVSLVIFTIPMLIIGLIIKFDSPGSILYQDERIGIDGQRLKMFKFRTMKQQYSRGDKYGGKVAEQFFQKLMNKPEYKKEFETDFKIKNDPRITRFGHFLRRTSLDELPQLLNVLRGDMSLVGPRPIIKEEMTRYGTNQLKRHIVKPGMTGLWQVNGRNDVSYDERVKLDLYYIENWSLWLDIAIIYRTLFSLRRSAY